MTWVLIACISHGLICNVYHHLEYFGEQDCRNALEEKVRDNPHWTHIGCIPYDEAMKMVREEQGDG